MNNHPRWQYGQLKLGQRPGPSRPPSRLTEGIFDSNIDTSTDGRIRVALWSEWRAMLSDLRKVGVVWSIVRNGHCVLAVQGEYPELTFSSDELVARATFGNSTLLYRFDAWRQATACDTTCCCGRVYGVEIENRQGNIFHKICLAKGTELGPFINWTQFHQATGLELSSVFDSDEDEGSFFRPPPAPGTLLLPPNLLRTVLISAAEREIPLDVRVSSSGLMQSTRIEVNRASESHGWLVFSGVQRSLYVESEPSGWLRVEPGMLEGESIWVLSLVDEEGRCYLRVQTGSDWIAPWNRLVQERVLVT